MSLDYGLQGELFTRPVAGVWVLVVTGLPKGLDPPRAELTQSAGGVAANPPG